MMLQLREPTLGETQWPVRQAEAAVLEARRDHMSVISVDVAGSMWLSASMSAEHWWTLMERLFILLTDGVHRFGGWVDRFTGDGVMAVFGIDGEEPDHAARACAAALWLRDEVTRHASELGGTQGLAVSV